MTRVLLCAGPALLVVKKDGALFFRRPGQPDVPVPYSPENYPIFLNSARYKYDLTPVVGPRGEQEPALPEGSEIPGLNRELLANGETVYRLLENGSAPGCARPREPVDKRARLLELARKRQTCSREGYKNSYKGIGDYHGGVYECDFVSPYTKSAGNVDAEVMVFLQDWSSDESLKGDIHQDRVTLGYRRGKRTNEILIKLLDDHFGLALKDIYATNLFPFIKLGRMSAPIPTEDMVRAAQEYGLPQLAIVQPRLAICLGLKTFNALRAACGAPRVEPIAKAIASPFCHDGTIIYCQAHPAVRAKDRSREQVFQDWSTMALCYTTLPKDRAEIGEWLRRWLESQEHEDKEPV
jgi:restriction system protein